MKQRIEHLLATDDSPAAISLAKQHNLVCRGAAFVAWDQHEKVPVAAAEEAIYQPSMLAKSKGLRGGAATTAFYEGAELTDLKPNTGLYGDVHKRRTSRFSMLFGSKPESEQQFWEEKLRPSKTEGHEPNPDSFTEPGTSKTNSRSELAGKTGVAWELVEDHFQTSWLSSQAGYALVETVCRWALKNPEPWERSQDSLMLLGFLLRKKTHPRESLREWITSAAHG